MCRPAPIPPIICIWPMGPGCPPCEAIICLGCWPMPGC